MSSMSSSYSSPASLLVDPLANCPLIGRHGPSSLYRIDPINPIGFMVSSHARGVPAILGNFSLDSAAQKVASPAFRRLSRDLYRSLILSTLLSAMNSTCLTSPIVDHEASQAVLRL
ncbi:unnamed protein product [Dibothriocephalus latus]|uniref:Uncharacterized protein n=1 Tax=Dibothriocephalus latus TaxID=60516 RepID=A0A3P7NZP4_DIBLA|nr:unnamed protein product [Dibothriocephalus latus]